MFDLYPFIRLVLAKLYKPLIKCGLQSMKRRKTRKLSGLSKQPGTVPRVSKINDNQ